MKYETIPGMTCCQMHRAAHIKLMAEMRTWFHLVPMTPRHILSFYESLRRRGLSAEAIAAGLSDVCPCKAERSKDNEMSRKCRA